MKNNRISTNQIVVEGPGNYFSHPERTITLATTFSGIGAVEQALQRLGLKTEILFAGDIDPYCKEAYMANYDIEESRWHNDVSKFCAIPFRDKVDLLVGGAPCQAFSIRGKRGGFEDTRGTLFSEFARLIQECKPKIFIFENVKGIINHDKGNTWDVIKNTFEHDCGYNIFYKVLNSRDYGIPQNRERLFCFGFKDHFSMDFPLPEELHSTIFDLLEKEVDPKYLLKQKGANFVTRTINHIKSYTQVNGKVALCQKRNQQFNWHGDFIFHPVAEMLPEYKEYIFDVSDFEEQYYITPDTLNYAVSLNGSVRMLHNHEENGNVQKGVFRKLTPRECLRLMGFPDSFKIVVPDTECYRQSGNSIVVDVFMALLKHIDITQFASC